MHIDHPSREPTISWDVRANVHRGKGEQVADFAVAFAAHLARAAGIHDVEWEPGPAGAAAGSDIAALTRESDALGASCVDMAGAVAVRARMRLRARSKDEAVRHATTASFACITSTLRQLGIDRRDDGAVWSVFADAYPPGSREGAWHLRIRSDDPAERVVAPRTDECRCPICGCLQDDPPWAGDPPSGSQEICLCCGMQFGYRDHAGGDLTRRIELWRAWRAAWVREGTPWRGSAAPADYDPAEQLTHIIE